MIYMLLSTGLRNKELRELTIPQIDFHQNLIYVDKDNKKLANSVVMSQSLKHELQTFLDHPYHCKWREQGNDNVFFIAGKGLTTNRHLNDIIKMVCRKAGIREITADRLRPTMAYLMDLNSFSLLIIHRQLRHKMFETTVRYLERLNSRVSQMM